jgi:hypothetical protein
MRGVPNLACMDVQHEYCAERGMAIPALKPSNIRGLYPSGAVAHVVPLIFSGTH